MSKEMRKRVYVSPTMVSIETAISHLCDPSMDTDGVIDGDNEDNITDLSRDNHGSAYNPWDGKW